MIVENWDILELLVQVSLNIKKRRIKISIRQKVKSPKVTKPILRGKKRMRDPPQILA